MQHGVNRHGINYYVINSTEFYCTYYDGTNTIELTIKDVTLEYIQNMTLVELIERRNNDKN